MIRSLALLLLITGLAYGLHGAQQRGQFRQVDEGFLDFLLGNTRERFVPDPAKLGDVVFAHIREADKAEYAAWPPPPIDCQMMAKSLATYAPSVLIIATPLNWGEPVPQFVPELAQTLLPLPRVVASVDIASASEAPLAEGTALQSLPTLQRVDDPSHSLPAATAVLATPAPEIAAQVELGCWSSAQPEPCAMAYRLAGQRVVPSLLLQALTAATGTPFSQQRLSTGPGAGLHLGGGVYVPLDPQAMLRPQAQGPVAVPSINALDLLTPAVAEDESNALGKILGSGKIIVLGLDNAAPQANALAQALAMPRLRELSAMQQFIVWGAAALLGLHLLHRPRAKALPRMLLLLFLALTGSYLAFQRNLTWCPPAIPALILVASGLFARVFGRAKNTETSATPSPEEPG